ncbi:MAG TPA: TetR/AcrR family transcriptional regulator [Acidimicrobiales bacterium]|jgi:AcrR family transcriptional regulator
MTAPDAPKRPYHHGNLRAVLLDAALAEIAERGPQALSLRELARRAGVSHAAPAHHFGDKAGLLTAIAAEGFRRLGVVLGRARQTGGFLDVGLAYVQFAVDERPYFEVMFRPDLYRRDDPAVVTAQAETARLLYGPAQEAFPEADTIRTGIAGWAFVHGFASLWLGGNLRALGDDPVAAAQAVAPALFTPSAPPPPASAGGGVDADG